jgi:hypothetical protein
MFAAAMFAAVKGSRLSRAPAGFFAELLGPTEQDESLRCASAQVKNWGVRPLLLPPGTQKFERTTLGSRSFIVVRIYVR